MKDKKKQEFVLLFLIIVLSLAMGLYFGNKVVVEGFGGIDKIKEGLSKAHTVGDVKKECMRVINRAKKTKDNVVESLKVGVLNKLGLVM
jgi:uncharacterized protein (UPF0333 family)